MNAATSDSKPGSSSPMDRARAVKRTHEAGLMALPNVVGVGIGLRQRGGQKTKEVALVVMVDRKVSADGLAPDEIIPDEIEGVPVDVQEVGQLRALD